jgi:hypothetical protein
MPGDCKCENCKAAERRADAAVAAYERNGRKPIGQPAVSRTVRNMKKEAEA